MDSKMIPDSVLAKIRDEASEYTYNESVFPEEQNEYIYNAFFAGAKMGWELAQEENQKLREAIKFYSQKDNFCLYDDISEAEWKDNWIGERYSQFVLSPIGRKAREALNESEEG